MDEKRNMFTSITLSEPIVAHAATPLLIESSIGYRHVPHTCPYGWSTAISTLTNALLYPGLVEKGLRTICSSYLACLHRLVIGNLLDLGAAPGEPQFQYIPSVGGQGPRFWGIHLEYS